MTDGAALRALIERERPALIVPEIEAIATDMLLQVEADGLAQVIPTARAAQLTMNREGIRRLAAEELGLPTSRYAFVDSLEQLRVAAADIGFPCFVKPVMSSSGKGQSRVHDAADLERAWQHALDAGRVRQARLIVEEQIAFDYEITLLTVRSLGMHGDIETHYLRPDRPPSGARRLRGKLAAAADERDRLCPGAGHRRAHHAGAGWARHLRRGAVRAR